MRIYSTLKAMSDISKGDSARGSENVPGDVTSVLPTRKGRVFERVGILNCASSINVSGLIEKLSNERAAEEKLFMLQRANVESSKSAAGCNEGTSDTSARFIEAPSAVGDTGEHLERMDVDENSMEETDEYDEAFRPDTPSLDVYIFNCPLSQVASLSEIPHRVDIRRALCGLNPEDPSIREDREGSENVENILKDDALDILAKSEKSYLALSGEDVKRLSIQRPPYNLVSKEYKPMEGFVGKEYLIVTDVSGFSHKNIVVHVISDIVVVYAKKRVDEECSVLHKMFKIPLIVNKELLRAHMLNKLKLCISGPVKKPVLVLE